MLDEHTDRPASYRQDREREGERVRIAGVWLRDAALFSLISFLSFNREHAIRRLRTSTTVKLYFCTICHSLRRVLPRVGRFLYKPEELIKTYKK